MNVLTSKDTEYPIATGYRVGLATRFLMKSAKCQHPRTPLLETPRAVVDTSMSDEVFKTTISGLYILIDSMINTLASRLHQPHHVPSLTLIHFLMRWRSTRNRRYIISRLLVMDKNWSTLRMQVRPPWKQSRHALGLNMARKSGQMKVGYNA